mgnify:CR=1 FL=1
MKRFGDIFHIAVESLFWVLFLWFVYLILLKIFGHSPTDTQLLYGGFSAIMIYLVGLTFTFGRFSGKADEFMSAAKNSFALMRNDMSVVKNDTSELKQDMSGLKRDVTVLKDDVNILKGDVTVLKDDVKVLKNDMHIVKKKIV